MFCKSCGKQLFGNEAFCSYCGERLQPPSADEAISATPEGKAQCPVYAQAASESGSGRSPASVQAGMVAGSVYTQGSYLKNQIRRVSFNRMILYGILSLFLVPAVLPLFISLVADHSPIEDIIISTIFLGIPTIIFVLLFVRAIISYSNYSLCAIYKKMNRLSGIPSNELYALLNREVETSLLFSHKRLMLTEHWACIQGRFTLRIFPAANLFWAYMFTLNGTFRKVIFALSNGSVTNIPTLSKKICMEILTGVQQSYLHVRIGYTKAYEKEYQDLCSKRK